MSQIPRANEAYMEAMQVDNRQVWLCQNRNQISIGVRFRSAYVSWRNLIHVEMRSNCFLDPNPVPILDADLQISELQNANVTERIKLDQIVVSKQNQ